MSDLSIWDKIRLYGGAITGSASSFVTGACIGLIGRSLIKNPILKVVWYIGGASIGTLVGKKVEEAFGEVVTDAEEVVICIEEIKKAVKDTEVV